MGRLYLDKTELGLNRRIVAMLKCSAAITLPLWLAGPALSQTTLAGTQTVNPDDIVVTARRTEERLQDVPLAITAFNAAEIQHAGIQSLDDLAILTPGLTFNSYSNGNYAIPTIRGVAQTDIQNIENNVSVFLNGVYLSNKQALDISLLDLQRIEVVRGPQSALYGRNSFAGAINYVTAPASQTFEAKGEASAGTDDYYGVKGTINLPITSTLAVRASGGYQGSDGTIRNRADPGNNLGGYKKTAALGAVSWAPSAMFKADGFFYHSHQDLDQNPTYSVANNCGFGVPQFGTIVLPVFAGHCGPEIAPDSVDLKVANIGANKTSWLSGLSLELKLSEAVSLHSLTSYGETKNRDVSDNDFSSAGTAYVVYRLPFFAPVGTATGQTYTGNKGSSKDFSQEVRIDAKVSSSLALTLGAFYSDTRLHDLLRTETVFAAPLGALQLTQAAGPIYAGGFNAAAFVPVNTSDYKLITKAVFGRASFKPTDTLTIAGEVRYTWEDRSAYLTATNFAVSPAATVLSPGALNNSFDFWTPRATVQYEPSRNLMVYASAARGVKSGGFNNTTSTNPAAQTYAPEENWTYEVGLKTTTADGMFSLNADVFYIDWQALQIQTFVGSTAVSVITNVAGGATVKGGEFSVTMRPATWFSASVSYAYADPTFKSGTTTSGITARDCGVTSGQLCTIGAQGYNVGGKQLARTSRHTATASFTAAVPLGGEWSAFIRPDVSFQSKQFINNLDVDYVPDHTVANLKIGIDNDRFGLDIWARNLFDERYATSAVRFNLPDKFPIFTTKPFIAPGRVLGVTLRGKY